MHLRQHWKLSSTLSIVFQNLAAVSYLKFSLNYGKNCQKHLFFHLWNYALACQIQSHFFSIQIIRFKLDETTMINFWREIYNFLLTASKIDQFTWTSFDSCAQQDRQLNEFFISPKPKIVIIYQSSPLSYSIGCGWC